MKACQMFRLNSALNFLAFIALIFAFSEPALAQTMASAASGASLARRNTNSALGIR